MHVHTGHLCRLSKAREIKSGAFCCIPAHGLNLNTASTTAATVASTSKRSCRLGSGRFGLFFFERICSPGENKKKVQEEASVQLKRAREKGAKRKKKILR
jgi:hypothetical protein